MHCKRKRQKEEEKWTQKSINYQRLKIVHLENRYRNKSAHYPVILSTYFFNVYSIMQWRHDVHTDKNQTKPTKLGLKFRNSSTNHWHARESVTNLSVQNILKTSCRLDVEVPPALRHDRLQSPVIMEGDEGRVIGLTSYQEMHGQKHTHKAKFITIMTRFKLQCEVIERCFHSSLPVCTRRLLPQEVAFQINNVCICLLVAFPGPTPGL